MGQDKPSRILDAAEALLVSFGYRRVTVDEVARRAGVGKGTVYLYWPSKWELFAAVLTREAANLLVEQLAALRDDSAEARLHRWWRSSFVAVMCRPLAKALYTHDVEVLGDLLTTSKIGVQFAAGKSDTMTRHLSVLHEHGLLSDDPAADSMLSYRLSAALTGFFLLEGVPGATEVDLTDKADALATTVHRAFEPTTEPTPERLHRAAADLIELYQQWLADLTTALPAEHT